MIDLGPLRQAHEAAYARFDRLIAERFPGLAKWHWYRACAAVRGETVRRNDDTTQDVALAADPGIHAAHNEYIRLLHIFYRARDGEHGVLGAYRT